MGLTGFRGLYPFMKKNTIGEDIKQLKVAGFYNVPLKVKGIIQSEPVVRIGDNVKQGSLLAKPAGKFGLNIFSPVSGKVLNILDKMSTEGEYCKHVLIMNDNKEEIQDLPAMESISDVNLIARLKDSGIIDTISNMPSYLKYAYTGSRSYRHLLILMDSTDPNSSVNQTISEFRMEEVVNGAKYFMNLTSAQTIIFVFNESNYRLANRLKKHILESKKNYDFKIRFIPNKYPFDNPYILSSLVLRKKITAKSSFLQEGIAIETSEACYNFCRAVEFNKPVISKIVTVDGTNILRPGNYNILNGYSFKNLLAEVGVESHDVKTQLISGNILSGTALYDSDASISLMDDTILYQKYNILEKVKESPCISCGKCISVCPVFINPTLLDDAYIEEDFDKLEKNNVHSCIECGCCSYVCPSKRFLLQRIVAGKHYERKRKNRG